ncbi:MULTISPECIES: phosphotransferase [unclassified Romboutsia]|uniref:phosphotransferase n=1 Tax=unclassified Romboutsia TaxID=2626894 RepID=UPI00082047B2|nr:MULTISPECIES: phosphotransferase [unclassified Romboutsia]SCI24988.1 Domain of uncharacterised function (DUF227) [uncultured Clostridium sp.]
MGVYKANSLKDLLSKNVLSKTIDNIDNMEIYAINTSGLSGSKMYKLIITSKEKEKVLYLKVNNLKEDWLAKVSNDKGRELTIFEESIFIKIEEFIKDVYIAYYKNDSYYAILMNDMSEYIGADKNSEDYYTYLDNLAKFHSKFNEYDIIKYKSLLSVEEYYDFLTEEKISEEFREKNSYGWRKIRELLGENLYIEYCELNHIDNKFSYYPKTFLHGDYRPDNALYMSNNEIRFIDWANSGCGPCTLDLFWYLISSVDYKSDKIDLIYYYKERIESYQGYKFTQKTWDTLLKVGIICTCRMFLATLISMNDINDKFVLYNIDWWMENLKIILKSIYTELK